MNKLLLYVLFDALHAKDPRRAAATALRRLSGPGPDTGHPLGSPWEGVSEERRHRSRSGHDVTPKNSAPIAVGGSPGLKNNLGDEG